MLSSQVLTISGEDFGDDLSITSVTVGEAECKNLKMDKAHERLTCCLPTGTGERVGVKVKVNEQSGTRNWLSYAPPVVRAVSGCVDGNDVTDDCPRNGKAAIKVMGKVRSGEE